MIDRIEQFLAKIREEKAGVEVRAQDNQRLIVKYEGAVDVIEALLMELKYEQEAAMQALSDQTQELEQEISRIESKIAARAKPTRRKRREGNPLPATPPTE